ncbi:Major fimbrium subunit FimA type-4 [Porphyromonas levii]|uniref:fimbrial protein n=1 Tax=Porphyromonas levii TaxID=28114 RepID=UPI001BAB95CB|nr:fimbrial protein [Porphyromonas levii]MBR8763286.1 Major fimbrium subunit FimA type-4 [Porphyromonas levii]
MKKSLFMAGLMSLAMVALVGCNKENNAPSADGAEATVSVRVQGAAMRAYVSGNDKADQKIHSLAAMVYNGEVQEAYKAVNAEATEITEIQCTAGDRKLVVVANFGDIDLKGKTLTDLNEMTLTLDEKQQDPAKKMHLMTSDITEVQIKAGKNKYGYNEDGALSKQPLKISHVHAGMELKSVEVKFNEAFAAKYQINLENEETELIGLIVKKQSKIFGMTGELAFGNEFVFGQEHKGKNENKYTPDTNYTEEASLMMRYKKNQENAGFYILENDSEEHPTILTLKTPLLDKSTGAVVAGDALTQAKNAGYCDDKGFTYYPVLVNWEKKGYTYGADDKNTRNIIERNHKYQTTMNITGPGTNEPEKPVDEPATLEVTVKVAPWVLVAQNVEW